jgi:RNA polymerase sigma factor (sigma-70 family)
LDKINDKDLTDRQLVERVLAGQTHAFETIIKITKGLVAQITFKMIHNNEDRQDIAQEVYLKAFNQLGNFRFQAKLSTWIGQITYNTCLNYLEKNRIVLIATDNEETHEEALDGISSCADSRLLNATESTVLKNEIAGILAKVIEDLPPLYKTLITLYHSEGLSYTEIGQITELPEGTVKNYLFRARKSLKEKLLRNYRITNYDI